MRLCINEPGVQLWFVTPFYKQTANIFKTKLLPMISPVDRRVFEYVNRSTFELKFSNGSYWQFHSAENPESLRTATLHYLIGDEVAYWRPGVFDETISPMLIRYGRRVYFASTPKGKNDFYHYDQRGTVDSPAYHPEWASFVGNYPEIGAPHLMAEVESKRSYLPPDVYRQEYLAEFVDGGGQVFRHLDRLFTLDGYAPPGKRHFVGIDLGQEHDRTVIVILDEKGKLVYMKRFTVAEQTDPTRLLRALNDIIGSYPRAEGWCESNFNPAIATELHKLQPRIFRKHMTPDYKTKMIDRLALGISVGGLAAPEHEQLRVELENFQVNLTATRRNLTFSAPPGGYDDCIMALGLAVNIYYNKMKPKWDVL